LIWQFYIWWLKCRGVEAACRAAHTCRRRLRLRILRAFGAQVGEGSRIEGPFVLMNAKGDMANLRVGSNCYIGPDTLIDLTAPVTIGDRVTLSMRTTLITHMAVGSGALSKLYPPEKAGLEIADDCYAAAGVTVLHGVTVGPRALIAAASLVRESIPPDTLAAGVPAVVKKSLIEPRPPK
jgi:maltose O-acetyltransferase